MTWKRAASVVVVAFLAGLPVSGALCAMVCHAAMSHAAMAAVDDGAATDCPEHAAPASDVQVVSPADRDCDSHDANLQQAAGLLTEKADWRLVSSWLTTRALDVSRPVPAASVLTARWGAPPRTPPPPTLPFVLRV